MKIRQILIIITFTIVLILFGLASYISYNMGIKYGEQNAETIRKSRMSKTLVDEEKIKSVSVININNSNIQSEINSSGRVVSLNNITISSEVSGKLEGRYSIKKGTKFRKGSVLFKIKNTDIKLLANIKKSNLMNLLSSNLADIKLDFPTEYVKWNEFFNSISLNSSIGDLPKTTTSKEKNFIISRGIMAEYLSIKSDEAKLRKYTVRAPFDGVIIESYTDIGANVNIGTPIIKVIKGGNMEVELTVSPSEVDLIELGNKVVLTDGSNKFEGSIVRIGSFVNENTQNISVFVSIKSDSDLLYNGMYLDAMISSSTIKNVCKIPRRSVFLKNKIFIVNIDNQLEIMDVNIIASQGNSLIVDNIINNTLVVSEPLINTKEGTIINPIIK